jgi:hypothetical protein
MPKHQIELISGVNIKTLNGEELINGGNDIVISGVTQQLLTDISGKENVGVAQGIMDDHLLNYGHLTPDQKAAADNANAPSGSNPFITANQIVGGLPTGQIPSTFTNFQGVLQIPSGAPNNGWVDIVTSSPIIVSASVPISLDVSWVADKTLNAGNAIIVEFRVVNQSGYSSLFVPTFIKGDNEPNAGSITTQTPPVSSGGTGHSFTVQARHVSGGDSLVVRVCQLRVTAQQAPRGDDGVGVIAGGFTNQALTKVDATNYNTQWSTIDNTFVGLGNVDNTSDVDKPISNATALALLGKSDTGHTHTQLPFGLVVGGPDIEVNGGLSLAENPEYNSFRFVSIDQLTQFGGNGYIYFNPEEGLGVIVQGNSFGFWSGGLELSNGSYQGSGLGLYDIPISGVTGLQAALNFADTFTTGATYSAGTFVFTNNTGGTFSVIQDILIETKLNGQAYVVWTGIGLIFDVIYPSYYIQGVLYSGGTQQVTLATADPTNPRIDVIGVGTTGVFNITGVASVDPVSPTINPDNQIQITSIFVDNAATTPVLITEKVIYKENIEWTGSSNIATADFNATSTPFQGAKHFDCNGFSNNQYVRFSDGATSVSDYTIFSFRTYLKGVFGNNVRFSVRFYNNTTPVSNVVTITNGNYGFNRTNISGYQVLAIPIGSFTFTNSNFNRVDIIMVGSNATGFRLDNVILQSNVTLGGPLQNTITNIVANTGIANATINDDTISILGVSGVTTTASGKTITIGFSGGSSSGPKWYAENAASPSPAPIATGSRSIALGDNAQALSNDMFVYGSNAGNGVTGGRRSNFIGPSAGTQAEFAEHSNFFGRLAGDSATYAQFSNFFGDRAGAFGINASYSTFIGQLAGHSATNANDSNFIGASAGQNAVNANNSNFLGRNAGYNATNTEYSNFIGNSAGSSAINANRSNFIGLSAGWQATNAYRSNFFGENSGLQATNANRSNFLGYEAGANAVNAQESNFFGQNAGHSATNADRANFIGQSAGSEATNAYLSNFFGNESGFQATNAIESNFIGAFAGYQATNARDSNFIGLYAGGYATSADFSNFIGEYAGYQATNASLSNFFGSAAGDNATNAYYSNFIGQNAGGNATNANNSNFIGQNAGLDATDASFSNFFGYEAGRSFGSNNVGSNNIIIGTNISLPSGATNSMNLGGVLFGRNTYSNPNSVPSITGQTSGRIGINIVNPTEALHVSGNTIIDGSISATTYINLPVTTFGVTIDGGGSNITTGMKGFVRVPYSGTIVGWDIISDSPISNCSVDLVKSATIPTSGNTITGGNFITLSSQQLNGSNTLTSWTTGFIVNDIFSWRVISATDVKWLTITIKIKR